MPSCLPVVRILSPLAIGLLLVSGCRGRHPGSYLPVGAPAHYGNQTNDGVTLTLPLDVNAAEETVVSALRGAGYSVEPGPATRSRQRLASRALGGDSTLRVTAALNPVELSESVATVVVLTATVDVPSQRILKVPVIQRPGEINALYGQVQALGTHIRERVTAAAP